jgi:DNA-binding HxlR family transcriptional regulator
LKELESYEIVNKEVMSTSPPSVYYSLTNKGQDLGSVMQAMAEWSLKWHPFED